MIDVPLERQLAAVRSEIAMRRHVYPRFIAQGRMTEAKANRQIAEMEAVRETLENLLADQQARPLF